MRIVCGPFWLVWMFTLSPLFWSVTVAYLHPLTTITNRPSPAILAAGKKRRRRQDPSSRPRDDDLPEFDLKDDDDQTPDATTARRSPKSNDFSNNEMMSRSSGGVSTPSSPQSARSVQDLIRDRSLESKLQFDEPSTDDSLPDLAVIAASAARSPASLGKKRARQEAQRSMMESQNRGSSSSATSDDSDGDTFWSKLPGIRDEQGKISPIKMLETGTWACIGILIVWEVYLNSPFFERAAPMAPIVYQ